MKIKETRSPLYGAMRRTVCPSDTPPQTVASPIAAAKCLTFALGSAFVSVSAVMSSVGQ